MELIIIVGIMLGIFGFAQFIRAYREHEQSIQDKVYAHLEKILHIVKEERINDQIYWYDEHSEEFLAQGHTEQDIIQVLRSRFPRHHFLFMDSTGEEVIERIAAPVWQREQVK